MHSRLILIFLSILIKMSTVIKKSRERNTLLIEINFHIWG